MNSSVASPVTAGDWERNAAAPSLLWYAPVVFAGAFLLFLVQPILTKQILPWFGGSAAVWTTALVFFQATLLAGYAYADLTTRLASRRTQVLIHIGLLACSLPFLPIVVELSWKPLDPNAPGLRIIGLLVATIGLPFFLLSSTSPLLQSWFAASFAARRVYRLFALSNAASLAGLLSYPFLIEPWIPIKVQALIWSGTYLLFALASATAGLKALRGLSHAGPALPAASPGWRRHSTWVLLAALASFLLIATTTHLTRDIASIPFLWILPLSLYLLTFAVCFDSERWYRRRLFLPAAAALLIACAWGLQADALTHRLWVSIPLYLTGLFVFCMVLHGELARDRPAAQHLTRFYLAVALGGALGGLVAGMAIPYLLPANFELGLGFVLLALGGAILPFHRLVKLSALGLTVACAVLSARQISDTLSATRVAMRNFYGMVQTYDTEEDDTSPGVRALVDGVIVHGEQYLDPSLRLRPIGYYGERSGIGRLMSLRAPTAQKVAVIGLGAGTMAAFGRAGDQYRFYEINPQVLQVARSEFTYLRDSKALITVTLGDGRLSLEREAPQEFDIIVVDAFSSDAVPVHLLTREALETYLQHLTIDGTIVFNVTNRYLNLASVALNLARHSGLFASYVRDHPSDGMLYATEYVLISRQANRLKHPHIEEAASSPRGYSPHAYWTDDFSNLLQILRRGRGG